MEKNLNTNDVVKLASFGGTFKEHKVGGRLVAFGSVTINQDALMYVSKLNNISGLLFYYCTFDDVNFSILSASKILNISILHGSFGDFELQQLKNLPSLKKLKLHGTKVTPQGVDKLIAYNSCLELL